MATIPHYTNEASAARRNNAEFFAPIDDLMGARGNLDTVVRAKERGLAAARASNLVASRLVDLDADPTGQTPHPVHGTGMTAAYNAERNTNGGMPEVDAVLPTLQAVKADADALWAKLRTELPNLTRGLRPVDPGTGEPVDLDANPDASWTLGWSDPAGSVLRDALQPELGTLHASLAAAVGAE